VSRALAMLSYDGTSKYTITTSFTRANYFKQDFEGAGKQLGHSMYFLAFTDL